MAKIDAILKEQTTSGGKLRFEFAPDGGLVARVSSGNLYVVFGIDRLGAKQAAEDISDLYADPAPPPAQPDAGWRCAKTDPPPEGDLILLATNAYHYLGRYMNGDFTYRLDEIGPTGTATVRAWMPIPKVPVYFGAGHQP